MYCTSCGEAISNHAEVCPKCGVRQLKLKNYCQSCGAATQEYQDVCLSCGTRLQGGTISANGPVDTSVNPILMGLVSFLIVGLGQIIMGQVGKGIAIFVGSIVLGFFTFGISAFITTPLAVVDAVLIAKKKQQGKRVGEWEFF